MHKENKNFNEALYNIKVYSLPGYLLRIIRFSGEGKPILSFHN